MDSKKKKVTVLLPGFLKEHDSDKRGFVTLYRDGHYDMSFTTEEFVVFALRMMNPGSSVIVNYHDKKNIKIDAETSIKL